MNGEIHQLLLITSLGNGYLIHGADASSKELQHTNSIYVTFTDGSQSWQWTDWLEQLRSNGCQRLMMVSGSQPEEKWQTSGFAGGGARAGIITLGAQQNRIWIPHWESGQFRSSVRWNITYTEQEQELGQPSERAFLPLSEVGKQFRQSLEQIAALAEDIEQSFWKQNFFDPGIAILDGASAPKLAFDLPDVYSDEARRLLNAVYKTWVFGAMGSWNDEPPYSAHLHDKSEEYERISAQLYAALLQTAQAAVNSVIF
ncbi:hypothetical protein [Paenibacillus bovis]|uniref:Uncharacterized protein n=1 Tax=Paenibacillus bovis TaxID=1616788 RepID=A0A172ZKV4_9BACL|nr:hypothetical protein [Paenibacillus bovis]ANF97887.1 hypothetical protein AR543_18935 [Paenibacillus bovis]